MATSDKMAVIERLLANRGLKVVRQTIETVRASPYAPIVQVQAYNQHIFVLNTHQLPPDTYVESDSNCRRYHVYGTPETEDTMDEFTGLVNFIFQDNTTVFGNPKSKVHNLTYARIISGPLN